MSGIFGKKQVLLAVLVVALGVAVYLNYYFANNSPSIDTNASLTSSKNLGDAQYVDASNVVGTQPTTAASSSDYFVQAKLNRQTARQEALDIISEAINNVKATEETQKEALEKAAAIAAHVEQESKIESLIKAKGFADCVVYIEDDNCHVVVQSEELTPAQALQITDIITAQSDIVAQKINIVTVK